MVAQKGRFGREEKEQAMKKYTFQMTKQELKELCFQMIKEQQRSRISRWLLIVAIIAFECIFFRELGFYIIAILLAIVFLFVRFIAENYARLKDRFGEKTCTIWVEEGMLKQDSQGGQYNEISCGSFTGVRRTGRLLILVMGANGKRKVWYPIPCGYLRRSRR